MKYNENVVQIGIPFQRQIFIIQISMSCKLAENDNFCSLFVELVKNRCQTAAEKILREKNGFFAVRKVCNCVTMRYRTYSWKKKR